MWDTDALETAGELIEKIGEEAGSQRGQKPIFEIRTTKYPDGTKMTVMIERMQDYQPSDTCPTPSGTIVAVCGGRYMLTAETADRRLTVTGITFEAADALELRLALGVDHE